MTEFTISIETNEGTFPEERLDDAVAAFEDAFAEGAAMSLDRHTQTLHATFQVQAKSYVDAANMAIELFSDALTAAGTKSGGKIEIAELGQLTIAPTRRPSRRRTRELTPA